MCLDQARRIIPDQLAELDVEQDPGLLCSLNEAGFLYYIIFIVSSHLTEISAFFAVSCTVHSSLHCQGTVVP